MGVHLPRRNAGPVAAGTAARGIAVMARGVRGAGSPPAWRVSQQAIGGGLGGEQGAVGVEEFVADAGGGGVQ